MGVNALYGPFLISTAFVPMHRSRKMRCQCPIRAFSNFYHVETVIKLSLKEVCQCPIRAFFNFYEEEGAKINAENECINALYGPFLISTVTPDKWLIFVVFQGCFYT